MRVSPFLLISFSLFVHLTASAQEKPQLLPATEAGIAAVEIQFPEGTPLGGYGSAPRRGKLNLRGKLNHTFFKPNTGVLHPIRSKTLVVRAGDKKMVFISLDLVGVTVEFHKDMVGKLAGRGYNADSIFLSATHTHSGPGGLSKNLFWGLLAMDTYQKRVYKALVAGILESVDQAEKDLEPAQLKWKEFDAPGLQHNRRNGERGVDSTARVIWVTAGSGIKGALINYAIHGIALDDVNLQFSSDIPGAIERGVEGKILDRNVKDGRGALRKPVAMLINGAEGDISPDGFELEGIQMTEKVFGDLAEPYLGMGEALPGSWSVGSGKADLGRAGLNVANCVRDARKDKPNRGLEYIKNFEVGLGVFFPRSAKLWFLDWGPLRMITWPGEPTLTLGKRLMAASIAAKPSQNPWVFGLTNGHLAYFTTPEEFRQGGYEPCFSVYGVNGGANIVDAYRDLWSGKDQ